MFMVRSGTEEGLSMAGKEDKTEISEPDAADPKPGDASGAVEERQRATKADARQISVSVRTLLVATVIVALLASVGVLTWLYLGANAKLDEEGRQAANNSHAERVALDYAVDAAKIDFQDLDTWKKSLVKGTTPELKEKLNSASTSMEQILAPLQWKSTAIPLVARVRSNSNGIYAVDTFVGVETKTVQAPDGLQSTATYSVTIDKNHDWQISDVGGIGAVVGQK
jgi:type II secretory pathway pseudopilin PulG